jgi:3-carboxy-cis,cis-muconate cycloisomerase
MPLSDFGLLDPLASPASAFVDDSAMLAAMVEVESSLSAAWGHAVALTADGLDLAKIAEGNRSGGNPVIPLVTQLRAQAGDLGDWVHRGATSQDILDSAIMLVASRAVAKTASSFATVADTLAGLADGHRHDVMVGRTLATPAAPITFGTKAASWLDGVLAGVSALRGLDLPVQLAGAVGTGAAFADLAADPAASVTLRAGLASRLQLADPGRSWQAERSPVATLASALAMAISVLGRIATDVLILTRPEIGELAEGSGGTSSAMPHKHNPTTAILIRSGALQAPGLLSTVHAAMVTEDERPSGSWHAEWLALRSLLRLAIETSEAGATMLASLTLDAGRMRANLNRDGGLAWAEHAQSQLTRDLGRQAASAFVARAIITTSVELPFGSALAAELDGRVVDLSDESVHATADLVIDAALARYRAELSE